MQFRTPVSPLKGYTDLIDHSRDIVLLGSCFSDSVGEQLAHDGFSVSINPCGTLYNPASIASALLDILYLRPYTRDDLFEHDGLWHSYMHHSRFSGRDPVEVLARINSAVEGAADALSRASVLFVTFGTRYIFRHIESRQVVANCHKMPASSFSREALGETQIYGLWKKMLRELSARFPALKVVFTVSPIRHKADGLHGNQLSKATLLLAVDRLVSEFSDMALYFPAYEALIDDLRDYRFYARDMMHPSDVAVDYVYGLVKESFMSRATRDEATLRRAAWLRDSHRPIM